MRRIEKPGAAVIGRTVQNALLGVLMKLKHAKAGGKIIALFTAAFFIGHFIGYAAEKMNPPAVPTAADGNCLRKCFFRGNFGHVRM